MTATGYRKDIAYDRVTKDFRATLDGELVGYFRNHNEAEQALNDEGYERIKYNIPPAVQCWGNNGTCQNLATSPSENPADMGLCEACLTGASTQAREQVYELQQSGALPTALEMAVDAEAALPDHCPLVDTGDPSHECSYSVCGWPSGDEQVAHELMVNHHLTVDEVKAMFAAKDLAANEIAFIKRYSPQPDPVELVIERAASEMVASIHAQDDAIFTSKLAQALAIETERIKAHHGPKIAAALGEALVLARKAQAKQMKHACDAFTYLATGVVEFTIAENNGGYVAHFSSQSADGIWHKVDSAGDTCNAATASTPRECWHGYGFRMLVWVTFGVVLGIDPAGLLPKPVVEVGRD